MEQGFQGKEGQEMPNMPDDFVWRVSERYQELYRILIGQPFEAAEQSIPPNDRIQNAVNRYFQ
jgi:phosphoribosylaminoimidazole-succinocarboxamide synthase